MDKQLFLNFIEKYSLSGLIESVAWESSDDVLKARVISDDKTLLGDVSMVGFDSKIFNNHKLGFFNTSRLVKMLGVMQDKIDISVTFVGEKPTSIVFDDDKNVTAKYALADLVTIPTVPAIKHVPSEFDVVINVTDDFINTFTKSKNALDVATFTIHATAKKVQIVFGQTEVNTDTITFNVDAESFSPIDNISFNADFFKRILLANKGTEAKFNVSKEGIAVIEYKTDTYTAKYFLVARSK